MPSRRTKHDPGSSTGARRWASARLLGACSLSCANSGREDLECGRAHILPQRQAALHEGRMTDELAGRPRARGTILSKNLGQARGPTASIRIASGRVDGPGRRYDLILADGVDDCYKK